MGLINSLKRLNESFFDGLKSGAIDRALAEAKKKPKTPPPPITKRMQELRKEKEYLDEIINKYSDGEDRGDDGNEER